MTHSRARTMLLGALIGAATLLGRYAAYADTIVIDEDDAGTVHDSIGDGWFFDDPMTAPPPDGAGDATGQALGIALKANVLELRAISEFPLADLEALDPADILSATLTVTIDDVLSTFGPGADFGADAATSITAFGFAGDGTIALADFGNVAGAPLATIDTTPRGAITDASLAATGPEAFTVDVTARVKTILAGSATHFGVVLLTTDDQSGTSLDALSPPGVAGATLPFLTITTPSDAPTEPPVLGKAAMKCQKALAKQAQSYASAVLKNVTKCFDLVLTAVAKGQAPSTVTAKCAAAADPATPTSKLATARTKAQAGIVKACTGVTPADLGSPCNPVAADIAAVATCTLDTHRAGAERDLRDTYAAACAILTSVGLDAGFAGICQPL
jgi:hypothetical protein